MSHWETVGQSSEWYTPPHVFAALGCRFDLDVAAPNAQTHVPADRFITEGSLEKGWSGYVWCNAPFEGRNALEPWLDKFFAHGNGIALTPDRTSCPWFRKSVKRCDLMLFTPKLRFLRPDGSEGKSPSNGTCLFASGDRAVAALVRAEKADLGFTAIPGGRS